MDLTTLALAKSYTDQEVEKATVGGVDLSGYYTKKEIDDMNFITENEIPKNIVIDETLAISGAAADAKTTGDRLNDIEYQTVTTEEAYEHKDLPEGEKTVTINSDGTWGDTAYVCIGEDLIPKGSFNQTFPFNGITLTRENNTYLRGWMNEYRTKQ